MSEWLGAELRRMREERGISVEGLAEKSGVSVSTIREVERGAREARMDTVAKLAKPLGLTFDEVWGLDEQSLLARLRSVRASGDRASLFAYWSAARSHQGMRDDAMGRPNRVPTELSEEIAAIHDELGGPERRRRIADAKTREAKAGEVLLSVGSLKRGGSTSPARAYLNKKYART